MLTTDDYLFWNLIEPSIYEEIVCRKNFIAMLSLFYFHQFRITFILTSLLRNIQHDFSQQTLFCMGCQRLFQRNDIHFLKQEGIQNWKRRKRCINEKQLLLRNSHCYSSLKKHQTCWAAKNKNKLYVERITSIILEAYLSKQLLARFSFGAKFLTLTVESYVFL
jgi:hypothetical protein